MGAKLGLSKEEIDIMAEKMLEADNLDENGNIKMNAFYNCLLNNRKEIYQPLEAAHAALQQQAGPESAAPGQKAAPESAAQHTCKCVRGSNGKCTNHACRNGPEERRRRLASPSMCRLMEDINDA